MNNISAQDAHLQYILRLADNTLILSQRLGEWCGHGPILEEDLGLTNTALDLIGQARLLYTHAGALEGKGRTEDDFAFWRSENEFRNWTLAELPNGPLSCGTVHQNLDYAVTMVRNFLFSALMVPLWQSLESSTDAELAAIAAKSSKEARYHLRHSRDWLVRFGDGTDESHARAQAALDSLLPYCNEIFAEDAIEQAVAASGQGVAMAGLRDAWRAIVQDAAEEATLRVVFDSPFTSTGKLGVHSEHMGFLLAEMQSTTRAHPGAQW